MHQLKSRINQKPFQIHLEIQKFSLIPLTTCQLIWASETHLVIFYIHQLNSTSFCDYHLIPADVRIHNSRNLTFNINSNIITYLNWLLCKNFSFWGIFEYMPTAKICHYKLYHKDFGILEALKVPPRLSISNTCTITIMDKIFETNSRFHVKQQTTGKSWFLFFSTFCDYSQNLHFRRMTTRL